MNKVPASLIGVNAKKDKEQAKLKELIIERNAFKKPGDSSKTTPRLKDVKVPTNNSPTVTQFSQNPYLDLRTKPNDQHNKSKAGGVFSFLSSAGSS